MNIETGATKRMWLKRWNALGGAIVTLFQNKYFYGVFRFIIAPLTLIIFCFKVMRTAFFYDRHQDVMNRDDAIMGTVFIVMVVSIIFGVAIPVRIGVHNSANATVEYIEKARNRGECERDFIKMAVNEILEKRIVTNKDIDEMVKECDKRLEYLNQRAEIKNAVK